MKNNCRVCNKSILAEKMYCFPCHQAVKLEMALDAPSMAAILKKLRKQHRIDKKRQKTQRTAHAVKLRDKSAHKGQMDRRRAKRHDKAVKKALERVTAIEVARELKKLPFYSPEVQKARNKAKAQLREGITHGHIVASLCFCGKRAKPLHKDYAKPFDADWFCPPHMLKALEIQVKLNSAYKIQNNT